MVNKELFDYIKSQLESGQNPDEVRKILLQAGWTSNDIREAAETVRKVIENQRIAREKMAEQKKSGEKRPSESNYTYGLLLSMLGGMLILINGVYTSVFRTMSMDFFSSIGMGFYLFSNEASANTIFGITGAVIGLIIMAVNIHKMKPGGSQGVHRRIIDRIENLLEGRTGFSGLITFLLSVLGLLFGGLYIGPAIGVIGGILRYLGK